MTALWQKLTSAGVELQCLTFAASGWARPILYKEIAVLDRFALRSLEPAEADGQDLHVFYLPRLASLLAGMRPLAMLLPEREARSWLEALDRVSDAILTV